VHSNTRTVRTSSTDGPRATGALWTVRDVQADGPPNSKQPKTVGQTDRNEDSQEHGTNTKNPRPTGFRRTVRAYQADCPPGANRRGNSSSRANPRAPYHLSFHGSPKRLKLEGLIRRTREEGSEWETIKVLLEGDGNSNKMNTASNTRL
jgi:hypothetical protein